MPEPAILRGLNIISFVHVDLLTSEYFSRWIIVLYSPLLLSLSFLLSTAWNTLTGLHGAISHLEARKKMHWVFESSALVLELHRLYSKTWHILLNSDCYHFSLVAFLTLVLSTGITLCCDHTLVALGYVYLLWLEGRSSQKSISGALPISTLSEHYREILSKTKL